MIIYLTNIVWVTIWSIISVRFSKQRYVVQLDRTKEIPNLLFISIVMLSLMSLYALRWYVGTDFGHYYFHYFNYGSSNFGDLYGKTDYGYLLLTYIIYNIWPDNFILYNYILAAITYIPVVLTYRRYSNFFVFTLLIYILSVAYYWPFNGVRQSLAGSITFLAYPFLYKKQYLKYSLLIIVAYFFHSTAILMLLIQFLVTKRAWSKPIYLTIGVLSFTFMFLPSLWENLINLLQFIGLNEIANDYRDFNTEDNGVNILRILVAAVPVIISFIFYKKLKSYNKNIDLIINMSLFYFVFMFFASQLTILARLSQYFIFFNALLIPEFANLFDRKGKVLFYYITLILFLLHMLVILPVDSNLLPYRTIFQK